jgi:probable F420-dependent oxidoreductase
MAMKIGIVLTVDGVPGRAGEFIAETAQAMEELGYASYWAPDHVAFFDTINSTYPHSEDGKFGWLEDQGLMEPIMVLQMAAAATKSIRVGTSVEVITLRNPVVRSKHVATVDHFSGGRFDYGVGIGWMKEEYDASGVPWERRGERADEYIGAMKALWTQDRASFHGEFVNFDNVVAFPKPVQKPHPPVLVGGITKAAIRRAARHGDGWYGWKMTLDEIDEALVLLKHELELAGRSLDDGFRLVYGIPHHGDPNELHDYMKGVAQRGITEFNFGLALSRRTWREQIETYARAFIA